MQYQIKVQGQNYKTITAAEGYSVAQIYVDVRNAIAHGGVTVDHSKPVDIKVVKV